MGMYNGETTCYIYWVQYMSNKSSPATLVNKQSMPARNVKCTDLANKVDNTMVFCYMIGYITYILSGIIYIYIVHRWGGSKTGLYLPGLAIKYHLGL